MEGRPESTIDPVQLCRAPIPARVAALVSRAARVPSVRLTVTRLLQAVPGMVGVTFITFALMNLLPGGSAVALAGQNPTPAAVRAISLKLHLDQSFFVRYWHWLSQAATGHLGSSMQSGVPVSSILAERLPVTVEMVLIALAVSVVASVIVSVLVVHHPGGLLDRIVTFVSVAGVALPGFVFGILLILVFAVELHLLPALGYEPLSAGIWPNLRTLLLPCATLAFPLFSTYTRVLRADILDQLNGQDYVVTARAKGLPPSRILTRHALRNSLFSLLTLVGLNLGVLIGGTVLIEQIFAIPGVGQELINAIQVEDVIVVEGVVVTLAAAVILMSVLTDVLYAILDPRIRHDHAGA